MFLSTSLPPEDRLHFNKDVKLYIFLASLSHSVFTLKGL